MKDTFLNKVIRESDVYSGHYIDSTRRGMAMMKLLGFKRSSYTVRSESKDGGNWSPAKIRLRKPLKQRTILAILANVDKILEAGFSINYFIFPQHNKQNFIFMNESGEGLAKVNIFIRGGGAKVKERIIGQRIIAIRKMTQFESRAEGWEDSKDSVALILENGIILYASKDEEGNDAGVMFGINTKDKKRRMFRL